MKLKFIPNNDPELPQWKDWVEETNNTPLDNRASFYVKDFRCWMLKWVFK